MSRPHRVPLSRQAVNIVAAMTALPVRSHLVFPSAKPDRPLSDNTPRKLTRDLGYEADVHGLRSSFRQWVQEQTVYDREVAEAALAHAKTDRVEAAYARSDLFEKRKAMMQSWADYLAQPVANGTQNT